MRYKVKTSDFVVSASFFKTTENYSLVTQLTKSVLVNLTRHRARIRLSGQNVPVEILKIQPVHLVLSVVQSCHGSSDQVHDFANDSGLMM